MENKKAESGGVGLSGLLQLAFIILKLCGVIDWKWWQVLLPTIIGVGIVVLILIGAGVVGLAAYIVEHNRKRRIHKRLKEVRK